MSSETELPQFAVGNQVCDKHRFDVNFIIIIRCDNVAKEKGWLARTRPVSLDTVNFKISLLALKCEAERRGNVPGKFFLDSLHNCNRCPVLKQSDCANY